MDTIHVSFDKCYQLFVQSADSSQDEASVISTIAALESCIERVISADLYSKSEGLDEYSTHSLKVSELPTTLHKWRISRSMGAVLTFIYLCAPQLMMCTSRVIVKFFISNPILALIYDNNGNFCNLKFLEETFATFIALLVEILVILQL
jgi:hypothetical protein